MRSKKGLSQTLFFGIIIIIIIAIVVAAVIMTRKPSETTVTQTPTTKIKIAVVSDIGGRGDLSFNDMAFKGADEAAKNLGVDVLELVSQKEEDYLPNLRTAASDPNVKLIVGVGFLLSEALYTVAQEYPDKFFAGIDTYTQSIAMEKLGKHLPNMLDIKFEEHKGSALVGALACLLLTNHQQFRYVGMVLGIEIPVLWKFEIGYKWGCDWALQWYQQNIGPLPPNLAGRTTKDIVLWTYTGTFSDITKGYAAAKEMYDRGAIAVYNVAGPLGLGINQAVQEIATQKKLTYGPPYWIGVDANQDWINPGFVIASMMKRVDKGVYYATQLVVQGKFKDVVEKNKGVLTLGIGTVVEGIQMEGIKVSDLNDLDEFIQMGVRAEQLSGKQVLPMPPDQIKSRVQTMRASEPQYIWNALAQLEEQIRSGKITVPLPSTQEEVQSWRSKLG